MHNFELRYQTLLEGLKNPKDNPCWKGYKPVGTKKKNGRTVPNCVPKESKKNLTENYFPVKTSFADLPKDPPYGFWVWGTKYVVAPRQDDHIKILREIIPSEHRVSGEVNLETVALKLGLIRMVREYSSYHLHYLWSKPSTAALKLAKNIAEFYNLGIIDDNEESRFISKLTPSPDKEL